MAVWEYQRLSKQQSLTYRDLYQNNDQFVLLLHGLGVDSQSWIYQEKALGEAGYRPIIPDLPGFGSSSSISSKWSVAECARILFQFASEICNTQLVIIGISLGGAIALKMLAEHPEKYSQAVLINSFSKIRPEKLSNAVFLASRIFKVFFLSIEDQANYMAKRLFPNEGDATFRDLIVKQITNTDPEVYKRSLISIGVLNLDKDLKRIITPCLMITGSEDSTIPPTSQSALARKIIHCQQCIIKAAGHAVIVQKPLEVNQAILKFINNK